MEDLNVQIHYKYQGTPLLELLPEKFSVQVYHFKSKNKEAEPKQIYVWLMAHDFASYQEPRQTSLSLWIGVL